MTLRIAAISRRERKRNKDIRNLLGNYYTTDTDTETETVWSCVTNGCEQALSTKLSGHKSKGRPRTRWVDCIREDVTQQGNDMQTRAGKRFRKKPRFF